MSGDMVQCWEVHDGSLRVIRLKEILVSRSPGNIMQIMAPAPVDIYLQV